MLSQAWRPSWFGGTSIGERRTLVDGFHRLGNSDSYIFVRQNRVHIHLIMQVVYWPRWNASSNQRSCGIPPVAPSCPTANDAIALVPVALPREERSASCPITLELRRYRRDQGIPLGVGTDRKPLTDGSAHGTRRPMATQLTSQSPTVFARNTRTPMCSRSWGSWVSKGAPRLFRRGRRCSPRLNNSSRFLRWRFHSSDQR